MQRFYALLLLAAGASLSLSAQNGIVGTGFSTGWNVPADNTSFSPSAGGSRILITTANGTGDQYFRLVRNAGDDDFYRNGQFGPIGCSTDTDLSAAAGAVNPTEGCGVTAFFVNVDDVTHNYVFKTRGEFADPVDFIYFEVEGPIQEIPGGIFTAQSPLPDENGFVAENEPVLVGTLLATDFSPGQTAYLRYTTDGFATSTVIPMDPVGGGFYTALIPGQADGVTVDYYLFTSGDAVAPAPDGSDADFRTINLRTDVGGNFTYTINRSLPVTYASWTGRRIKADAVQLDWATASEDQASHFTLECSQDAGRNWMERALIPAANLSTGATYSFTDEGTPTGDLQYRLKQTDFDGAFEYSAVITVAGERADLEAWPQPVNETLNLRTSADLAGTTATLIDLNGRTIRSITLTGGQQTVNVSGISPGIYLLRAGEREVRKVVIR